MNLPRRSPRVLAALFLLNASVTGKTHGAISITRFILTPTSVSFDISGTMPATRPDGFFDSIFFVNPSPSANPGFALGDFLDAASYSFTGVQQLRASPLPIATGGTFFGDYFYVALRNALSPNEAISGTVSASWSSLAFEVSRVSALNVFWGADSSGSPWTGTVLGQVSIPEPTCGLLIVVGTVGVASRRKRWSHGR